MAGFGMTDDILPWTPDSYGQALEVAPTQGLGLAQDPTPAPSPEAAQATIMDIPASQVPGASPDWAGGGGGIERAMQPSKGDAWRQQHAARIDRTLGSWEENPLQRLAFVLQAGLAGAAGQKPAYQSALEQAEKREGLELQKALTSLQVVEHAQKAGADLSPEKRAELVGNLKKRFGPLLGAEFGGMLDAGLSGGMDVEAFRRVMGARGNKLLSLTGNSVSKALELAKIPEIGKQLDAADDKENTPIIAEKGAAISQFLGEAAQKDPKVAAALAALPQVGGRPRMSLPDFLRFNAMAPAGIKLSESELGTLTRNPGLQIANGITPPDILVKGAEAAAGAQARADVEIATAGKVEAAKTPALVARAAGEANARQAAELKYAGAIEAAKTPARVARTSAEEIAKAEVNLAFAGANEAAKNAALIARAVAISNGQAHPDVKLIEQLIERSNAAKNAGNTQLYSQFQAAISGLTTKDTGDMVFLVNPSDGQRAFVRTKSPEYDQLAARGFRKESDRNTVVKTWQIVAPGETQGNLLRATAEGLERRGLIGKVVEMDPAKINNTQLKLADGTTFNQGTGGSMVPIKNWNELPGMIANDMAASQGSVVDLGMRHPLVQSTAPGSDGSGSAAAAAPGAAPGGVAAPGGGASGMVENGNINLGNRPTVRMSDGSIATVRSMSIEADGKHILIPTVSDDGKIMSPEDAIKQFRETGKHLGKFDTPENATAYAKQLSAAQGRQYAPAVSPTVDAATPAGGVLATPPTLIDRGPVLAPGAQTKEQPEKPLDTKTQTQITAGTTLLDHYRKMRELSHLVGDPVKGATTIVKGAFNPWGVLGDSTQDANLRAVLNGAAALVNQTIPGVGTDKDQILYRIAAVPSRMDPKQTWDATIKHSEDVAKAMLTDAVAFHKSRGSSVPKEIIDNLKAYGIDEKGVRKWDGKGDSNAKSATVAVEGLSDGALQAVAKELLTNRAKFSKTAAEAIIREVEKMEAGKRGK